MFTFEENHQAQAQDHERQRQNNAPSRIQQQDNMGHLQHVVSGKNHTLNMTRDGDVFTYGPGLYGAVGHGGSKEALAPQILKPLRDKRITQIACGEFHSLILTDKADVYTWGRGFEGQLGLSKSIEIASTPQFVKTFYGKPIKFIAAGAFYSLAITKEGSLYGWGEAKLGQLGMGKQRIV
jgi:alpha-tubulin suppressor-like RCC1 family protein